MSKKNQGIELPSFLNATNAPKNGQYKQPKKNNNKVIQSKKLKKKAKIYAKTKKTEQSIHKSRRAFKIIIFLMIITSAIVAILLSPLFNITQIDISLKENSRFVAQEIIAKLEIPLEENMFKIRLLNYKKILEEEPYIEQAIIKRKIPNAIRVEIKERTRRISVRIC